MSPAIQFDSVQGIGLKIALEGIAGALLEMESTPSNRKACRMLCGSAANICALAGEHGGSEQQAFMDYAVSLGFTCYYYAGGLRVEWNPEQ